MRVRLTKKFAEALDGIDLSRLDVGDMFDLPDYEGELLVVERWAEVVSDDAAIPPPPLHRIEALDRVPSTDVLRHVDLQPDASPRQEREGRRFEDRIRDELRDARSKTISPDKTSTRPDNRP